MIGDLAALAAANVAFFAAGLGITRALGVRRAPAVAYVTGVAAIGILAELALVAGLSLAVWQVLVGCAILAALGLVGRRTHEEPAGATPRPWLVIVPLGTLVLALLVEGAVQALDTWDAFAMWTMKARALVLLGGLDPTLFANHAYQAAQLDYPMLLPGLQAIDFHFMGSLDAQVVHEQTVLLLVGWLLACARLLRGRAEGLAIWAGLGMAAAAPATITLIQEGYADIPVAIFGSLAALCAWLYASEGGLAYAGLLAIFADAAASTKRDSWPFVLGLFVLTLVYARLRRRAVLPVLGGAALFAATTLVWLGWLAHHGYSGHEDMPISKSLSPGFLAGRIARVGHAIVGLAHYSAMPSLWLVLAPLALFACVVARRGAAVFLFATLAIDYAAFVWAFWISKLPVQWHVDHAAPRIVATPLFTAAVFLPLVVADMRRAPAPVQATADRSGMPSPDRA